MRVIRSAVCGFCMGVRRAVELAVAEADRVKVSGALEPGVRVYTLGPLIHNPVVLADLKNRGVQEFSRSLQNPEGCSLIIRAHGIDPRIEEELRARGAHLIDATCPKVKASQLKAQALAREGYRLFLAGEAQHAEITGILGYAGISGYADCGFVQKEISTTNRSEQQKKMQSKGSCFSCGSWLNSYLSVVSNAGEAQAAAKRLYETEKDAKTALIGQTTISEEEYQLIGEAIKNYFPDLEIVQTICAATRDRQQALRELLDQADAVIIAGGKGSANTRRLLAIAEESGKPCALAETAADIPSAFRAYQTVGLCAGASTPDSVIDEIERELIPLHGPLPKEH